MDKVFQRAEDKNVAVRIVYLNSEDGKLYYDAEFKEEVPAEDMRNLFIKGVVCDDGISLRVAVSYSEEGIVFFS